jgi:hypothetical protein
MAEPLRIEDYISPLPTPLDLGETGSPADLTSTTQSRVEEITRSVAQTEQKVSLTVEGVRRLLRTIQADPPINLDEVILHLQEMEESAAGALAPAIKTLAEHRSVLAKSANPHLRLRALTLVERLGRSLDPGLEALRDARWELMALRSELNRGREQRVELDGTRSLQELLGRLKS